MIRRLLHPTLALLALLTGLAASALPAHAAPQVWSGRTFLFQKPDYSNPLVYADRITANVWIARNATQGLYNAVTDGAYTYGAPNGTEWSTGDAVNHASLTFYPWAVWAGSCPPCTVGLHAVLHLIADDTYIDIQFTSWSVGTPADPYNPATSPGGFAYLRAPAPVTATTQTTWGRLKELYR